MPSRRTVLIAASAALPTAVAGCLGGASTDGRRDDASDTGNGTGETVSDDDTDDSAPDFDFPPGTSEDGIDDVERFLEESHEVQLESLESFTVTVDESIDGLELRVAYEHESGVASYRVDETRRVTQRRFVDYEEETGVVRLEEEDDARTETLEEVPDGPETFSGSLEELLDGIAFSFDGVDERDEVDERDGVDEREKIDVARFEAKTGIGDDDASGAVEIDEDGMLRSLEVEYDGTERRRVALELFDIGGTEVEAPDWYGQ